MGRLTKIQNSIKNENVEGFVQFPPWREFARWVEGPFFITTKLSQISEICFVWIWRIWGCYHISIHRKIHSREILAISCVRLTCYFSNSYRSDPFVENFYLSDSCIQLATQLAALGKGILDVVIEIRNGCFVDFRLT